MLMYILVWLMFSPFTCTDSFVQTGIFLSLCVFSRSSCLRGQRQQLKIFQISSPVGVGWWVRLTPPNRVGGFESQCKEALPGEGIEAFRCIALTDLVGQCGLKSFCQGYCVPVFLELKAEVAGCFREVLRVRTSLLLQLTQDCNI